MRLEFVGSQGRRRNERYSFTSARGRCCYSLRQSSHVFILSIAGALLSFTLSPAASVNALCLELVSGHWYQMPLLYDSSLPLSQPGFKLRSELMDFLVFSFDGITHDTKFTEAEVVSWFFCTSFSAFGQAFQQHAPLALLF